jgi:hypothetical protein
VKKKKKKKKSMADDKKKKKKKKKQVPLMTFFPFPKWILLVRNCMKLLPINLFNHNTIAILGAVSN